MAEEERIGNFRKLKGTFKPNVAQSFSQKGYTQDSSRFVIVHILVEEVKIPFIEVEAGLVMVEMVAKMMVLVEEEADSQEEGSQFVLLARCVVNMATQLLIVGIV